MLSSASPTMDATLPGSPKSSTSEVDHLNASSSSSSTVASSQSAASLSGAGSASAIGAEYSSSLADLTVNSKPLINMLTILAEENARHAAVIVRAIEVHLAEVSPDVKLPVLYLIDSIVKNVKGAYVPLFTQCIVNLFCGVFEKVNERVRANMYKLRQTWNEVFPSIKMYALDCRVNCIDPAWPITAQPPTTGQNIHVNPNFLRATQTKNEDPAAVMKQQLMSKQHELLLLERKKLELQLLATRKVIEEQERELKKKSGEVVTVSTTEITSETKSEAPSRKTDHSHRITNQPSSVVVPVSTKAPTIPVPISTGVRIAPVSSELIQATRKCRDPRLARQQNNIALSHAPNNSNHTQPQANINPNNVFDLSVNIFNKSNTNIKPDLSVDYSHSKRLANLGKIPKMSSNVNNKFVNSEPKSKMYKNKQSQQKSLKKSPESKKPVLKSDKKPSPKEKDISKSPRKSSDGSSGSPKKSSRFSDKKIKSPSGKSRYGGRRNRANSEELEVEHGTTKDVDLRVLAPPPEKQARLNTAPVSSTELGVDQKILEPTTKDVDLRPSLPVPQIAPLKKRPSPEKQDQPVCKRSKSETFDVLFGNEDVDLRKQTLKSQPDSISNKTVNSSPGISAETPPPPPIISKIIEDPVNDNQDKSTPARNTTVKGGSWAKVKVTPTVLPASPDKVQKVLESGTSLSSFEAVRAKLAEATKTRDKLGRPLLFSNKKRDRKLFGESDTRPEFETDSQDGMEDNLKIIMSQAQEQINNGSINTAQYNNLLKQLVQINENKKLQEAQRRESLEPHKNNTVLNENLTPISDDELELDEDGDKSPKNDEVRPNVSDNSLSNALINLQATNKQARAVSGGHRRDRFGNKQESRFNRHEGPVTPWSGPAWDQNWNRPGVNRVPVGPPPNFVSRNQTQSQKWNAGPNSFQIPRNSTPMRYDMPHIRSKGPLKLGSLNMSLPPPPFPLINYIQRDTMHSINIDAVPRDIRHYEETAVALMNWDDPREIGFQDGSRRICFDDRDSYLIYFNQPYTQVLVNGVSHKIRYGAPTRELYIDGKFYECFFGGAPIVVPLDGKMSVVKLEGPPPQVKLGKQRNDLVAGKITLIVDAKFSYPIFLDSKPQKVEIDNQILTIRFADSLKTVLINELPFQVEFGGLPKSIVVNERKHFIRFTVLPKGMKPGQVNIRNMGKSNEPFVDLHEDVRNLVPNLPILENNLVQNNTQIPPLMPPVDKSGMPIFNIPPPMTSNQGEISRLPDLPTSTTNIPPLLQTIPPLVLPHLDNSGYQMEASNSPVQQIDENSQDATIKLPTSTNPTAPILPPTINVNDLFEKLVASGILQGVAVAPETVKKEKDEKKVVPEVVEKVEVAKPVLFSKPETLKVRQAIFIKNLYKGMQCSSCGTRFPPEQTMRYSQHLDWHFRQNRRDRDSTRRPFSRKWYYDVSDWIQYEEIEDLEEREKNWFDSQQVEPSTDSNTNTSDPVNVNNESVQTMSVPAGTDTRDAHCDMCHDRFDQFYHEEKEEWYLKNAIRIEGTTYHPVCYDDYKASLEIKPETTAVTEPTKIKPDLPKNNATDNKIIDLDNDDTEDSTPKVEEEKPVEKMEEDEENVAEKPEIEESDDKNDDLDKSEDDDVHIHEEPVETVVLNDDEDEPQFEEIGTLVRVKEEPVSDNEDEIDVDIIEEYTPRTADNTQQSVISSIDGNVELEPTPATGNVVLNKIKINISTSSSMTTNSLSQDTGISVNSEDIQSEVSQDNGVTSKLKECLRGVDLKVQEPVIKGSELSGLCSIM